MQLLGGTFRTLGTFGTNGLLLLLLLCCLSCPTTTAATTSTTHTSSPGAGTTSTSGGASLGGGLSAAARLLSLLTGSSPSGQHGRPLLLKPLDNLELLNVLCTEDVPTEGAAERIVQQPTAVLVALGRAQRGLIDKLDGWSKLGTLYRQGEENRKTIR